MPGLREGNGKRCGTKYEEFLFYDGTFKIFACTQSGYRCQAVRRGILQNATCTAFHCRDCKKVIMDYAENGWKG